MTVAAAAPEVRRPDVVRRGAALGSVGAAVLLLGLTSADWYRYHLTSVLLRLCTLDGGPQCPGTIASRTGWHGPWGWPAVVFAFAAAAAAVTPLVRPLLARTCAVLGVGLSVASVALLVAAWIDVPRVADLSTVERELAGPGSRLHYGDLVVDMHAGAFWVALAVGVVGLGCSVITMVRAAV